MQRGYIKLHRSVLDSIWSRQPDFMAVWIYCLLRCNHKPSDIVTKGGKIVHLEPGEFITSRKQISIGTGVQESKVERILTVFKSEQQIEQQSHGHYRIISVTNWPKYQQDEQVIRTTFEQHLNTNKNDKNDKNKNIDTVFEERKAKLFEALWKDYPDKVGKQSCLEKFNKTVKTPKEAKQIDAALDNYLAILAEDRKKFDRRPLNAKTWFNNWRDYVPEDFEYIEEAVNGT